MKIILDAMGGDLAPEAPVLGAIQAAKDFGAQIVLVGRGQEILETMKKNGINDLPEGVEIANAEDVVDMHDDPAAVLHKRKNSSMVVGLKMLAEGQGDAVCQILEDNGYTILERTRDYNDRERAVIAQYGRKED